MRIGIDARLWNETGVGRYIRNLVSQLQTIDTTNDYTLFVRGRDYESIKNHELRIKEQWKFVKTDIHWHTLEEQIKFPSVIEKERIDLMHFPYFSVPILYRKPYVVTIHDLILHNFSTGKASTKHPLIYHGKRLGYKYIMKKAAENSKKIIAVSEATKQEIIDHLGISQEKIAVTYEGIDGSVLNRDISAISPEEEKKQSLVQDTKYFLYVGNVYPHKNVEKLISAFANLVQKHPEVKLLFVGKEDFFYRRLEEYVQKNNLQGSILFAGQVSDALLASFYKHAQALVVPSLMEGFGLPGLEAMAQKCLVLASDIPSFREIYGDAALYFNPTDIVDIEIKLENILLQGKSSYQDILKSAEKRVAFFSWEKMAQETLRVYKEILSP